MALNFPSPSFVGEVYQDPTSGNTYVCTSLGPPAQWVGSGSSTSLDSTYLRTDASNDPVTGNLILEPTTNVNPLLVKQPSGNTTPALRIENSGTGNSIEVGGVFSVSSSGVISTTGGTAAAPVISPTGDSNTGIFFPTTDTVSLSVGGVEKLRLTPNQSSEIISPGFSGIAGSQTLKRGYVRYVPDYVEGYVLISRVDNAIFAHPSEFTGTIFLRRGTAINSNINRQQTVACRRAYNSFSVGELDGPFPIYTLTYNSVSYYAIALLNSVKSDSAVDVYIDARVQGENIGEVVFQSEISNEVLFRNANNAYYQNNILGTVSQSGGVPTGAIIESGSNVNGSFVKYADGAQICYYSHSFDTVSTWSGTAGSRIKVGTWSYPAVFSETPHITASGDMFTFLGDINVTAQRIQTNSPSSAVILAKEIRAVGSLTVIVWGSYIAIGRWY